MNKKTFTKQQGLLWLHADFTPDRDASIPKNHKQKDYSQAQSAD